MTQKIKVYEKKIPEIIWSEKSSFKIHQSWLKDRSGGVRYKYSQVIVNMRTLCLDIT